MGKMYHKSLFLSVHASFHYLPSTILAAQSWQVRVLFFGSNRYHIYCFQDKKNILKKLIIYIECDIKIIIKNSLVSPSWSSFQKWYRNFQNFQWIITFRYLLWGERLFRWFSVLLLNRNVLIMNCKLLVRKGRIKEMKRRRKIFCLWK